MNAGTIDFQQKPLLARGGTSELFQWSEGQVLKLFHAWVDKEAVDYEFKASTEIFGAGFPVPKAFELLQFEDRLGILFEEIRGPSMLGTVEKAPWRLFKAATDLAELHAGIHTCQAPLTLMTQRAQVSGWIEEAEAYTRAQKEEARAVLAELPDGNALCHGDFHPANIIYSERGPIIIDWAGATRGHALADVARTSVLFESANLPPHAAFHLKLLLAIARKILHRTYLARYYRVGGGSQAEVARWSIPQRALIEAWRARRRKRPHAN